jgi:hypothetical protein
MDTGTACTSLGWASKKSREYQEEIVSKKIPAHCTLESENWDRMTDNLLNSALSSLLPFLQHHTARTLADALVERLSTHLATELHYIRTGINSEGLGEYTSAQTFRDRFVKMGGIHGLRPPERFGPGYPKSKSNPNGC